MTMGRKMEVLKAHGMSCQFESDGRLTVEELFTMATGATVETRVVDVTEMSSRELLNWLGY